MAAGFDGLRAWLVAGAGAVSGWGVDPMITRLIPVSVPSRELEVDIGRGTSDGICGTLSLEGAESRLCMCVDGMGFGGAYTAGGLGRLRLDGLWVRVGVTVPGDGP